MTSIVSIVVIVEGQGDEEAACNLVNRIARDVAPNTIPIVTPFRHHRSDLDKNLEGIIQDVARLYPGYSILVLADSDDDCPATMGPLWLARAQRARPDLKVAVALAEREFEAWFLATIDSFRAGIVPPENFEQIRNAKKRVRQLLGSSYSPSGDQLTFARKLDLDLARRRSRSFRKFCKEVEWLLGT